MRFYPLKQRAITALSKSGLVVHGGGDLTSPEANAVLGRLSSATAAEKTAIETFVDSQVAAGNWTLLDSFQLYGLSGANALIDWIHGTDASPTTATVVNNAYQEMDGYYFPATTDGINTGVDLSSATNYTQDDCAAWIRTGFLLDDTATVTNPSYCGSINGSSQGLKLGYLSGTPRLSFNISSGGTSKMDRGGQGLLDNTLYGAIRSDSNSTFIVEGPAITADLGIVATAVSPAEVFINGYRNNSGVRTSAARRWSCQLWAAGAWTGFDRTAFNDGIIQLLVALGFEVADEVRIPLAELSGSTTRVIVRKDSAETVTDQAIVNYAADTIWTTEEGWLVPDGSSSNYVDLTSITDIRSVTRPAAGSVTVMSCHIKGLTTTHPAGTTSYAVVSYDKTASGASGWRTSMSNSGTGVNKFWQSALRLKDAAGVSHISDGYHTDRAGTSRDGTPGDDVLCFVVYDWDHGERTIASGNQVLATGRADFSLYDDGTIPVTADELGIVLFAQLDAGPAYSNYFNAQADTQFAIRDIRIATIAKPADQIIDRILRRSSAHNAARALYEL